MNASKILRLIGTLYFMFWMSLLLDTPAYAYIDPATTAMVTQVVAGIFISVGVFFGVFRRKIVLFFKNLHVKRTQRRIERKYKKETDKKEKTRL